MYERTGELVKSKFKEYLLSTVLTSLAMSLASVIDSVIVGNLLGDAALAAVGLSSPIIFCINLLYMLFGIGGMTFASISRGKRQKEESNILFSLTIAAGMAAMFIFVIIINALMSPISYALASGDQSLADLTAAYLKPLTFTGPALMFSSGMALFMRTDGRPQSSSMVVIIANAVNLILDFVLINYLNTGIWGAGASTSAGYAIGAVAVIPYLLSPKRTFRFRRIKKGDLKYLADIFRTGLPKGLTQGMSFLRASVLNALVMASLGSIGMSVMTVCVNVLMISNIFVTGTSDALLPIVGTLYGEQDYYGIKQTVSSAARVLAVAAACLVAFFMLAPGVVGAWFGLTSNDADAVLYPALRMFALYLPFNAANVMLQNLYTTTGRTKFASMIAVLDGFVFVCVFAALLSSIQPMLLWLCFACSGAATLLTVFLSASKVRRVQGVKGMLLLKENNDSENILDVTIRALPEEAAGLSDKVINFCKEHGADEIASNRLGVAIEEMAVNSSELAQKEDMSATIDIMIKILPDKLITRFRDDGKMFDPASESSGREQWSGVEVVKKLAANIDYARQLGFNTTVITISRVP